MSPCVFAKATAVLIVAALSVHDSLAAPPSRSCSSDLEFFNPNCNAHCELICGQLDLSPCPRRICRPSCNCKEGYIRANKNGQCIPTSQCSECELNQEYKTCGSACEPICGVPPRPICTTQCVQGCFCKKGFILEREGGRCIPERYCRTGTTLGNRPGSGVLGDKPFGPGLNGGRPGIRPSRFPNRPERPSLGSFGESEFPDRPVGGSARPSIIPGKDLGPSGESEFSDRPHRGTARPLRVPGKDIPSLGHSGESEFSKRPVGSGIRPSKIPEKDVPSLGQPGESEFSERPVNSGVRPSKIPEKDVPSLGNSGESEFSERPVDSGVRPSKNPDKELPPKRETESDFNRRPSVPGNSGSGIADKNFPAGGTSSEREDKPLKNPGPASIPPSFQPGFPSLLPGPVQPGVRPQFGFF